MSVRSMVKHSEYHDSVSLMVVARELSSLPGVEDAAVVMGTEANKAILETAGLLTDQARAATSNDLVIAVSALDAPAAEAALQQADRLLRKKKSAGSAGEYRPKSVRAAILAHPEANVAVISVAGRYAAGEAWEALTRGLHVLLFSDNVSLEDEIALKRYATERGLLLMGPGAGTAILNGVALGFANAVPSGPVGIVSAAGTGLQEVSALLAKHGVGITQGIGVGGRDLTREVGGIMMLAGLEALQADPDTRVIVLISKPPADDVAGKILSQVAAVEKPAVVCFLGGGMEAVRRTPNALPARTLESAGLLAARLAGAPIPDREALLANEKARFARLAETLSDQQSPRQRYLRGLFSGGTLCYEAQVIWRELLSEPVHSNAPLPGSPALKESTRSFRHTAVDLGEEEFTVGRPHPMIDNDLRIRRLLQEARDPETAVILLDVVLGYGAHPDPAAELGPAVEEACRQAEQEGYRPAFLASVTGTEKDPQGLRRTVAGLQRAGVSVCESNAAAARLAAMIVTRDGDG